MKFSKNLLIVISVLLIGAAIVAGIYWLSPSAEDILAQAVETTKTVTNGHAVVAISVDTIEQDGYGMLAVWARHSEGGSGAFRIEVLEASEEKARGAVIVSDGETLWAYSPSENKVFMGSAEEAQTMLAESEFMPGEFGDFHLHEDGEHKKDHHSDGEHEDGDHLEGHREHPESTEEAIEMLQEYVTIKKSGLETMSGETAQMITMEPIPEQMPSEYAAVGGLANLWIGRDSNLPLGLAYTGGSLGEFNLTVLELDLNTGLDDTLFTFEIPPDAEVITLADLEPQSLTLEEAGESAKFELLTPAEIPAGATLVDIVEVRGALVQRYTLPEGGSFTVAQGMVGENAGDLRPQSTESQEVDVRGTSGQLFESEAGDQVLLTWAEGDLFFSVAGNLTVEQALAIAESLQ